MHGIQFLPKNSEEREEKKKQFTESMRSALYLDISVNFIDNNQ